MMSIVILGVIIFIIVLVGGLIWAVREDMKTDKNSGNRLIDEQAQEKAEHLQKIMEFFADKDKVTNDDIQKLLGVSDKTVQRYFNELQSEGKITQEGETGPGVYYKKAQ